MRKSEKEKEIIFAAAAFTFFLLVSCHKLLNASLWFDETIEYWYSKYIFGTLPFENSSNMYERIVSTYQPPLYNVFMYFWLKIRDTEWWFRFFGVVVGMLGMFGIYGSIKKLCNSWIASIGVIFSSTVFRLVYYWQKCAEYCLMLGGLFLDMFISGGQSQEYCSVYHTGCIVGLQPVWSGISCNCYGCSCLYIYLNAKE